MVKVQSINDTSRRGPILSWLPVAGPDGRIHMEMRWHVGSAHEQGRTHGAA